MCFTRLGEVGCSSEVPVSPVVNLSASLPMCSFDVNSIVSTDHPEDVDSKVFGRTFETFG